MTRQLYDLVGRDDRRFSPYCWRAKLALLHKGLDFETVPIRFTDKDRLAFSGQDKVPVLRDGDTVVHDSWAIACHLEDRYPDAPSLFGGPGGRRAARLVNLWFDPTLTMGVFPLVFPDIFDVVLPEDLEYFTQARLQRFGGRTREDFARERSPEKLAAWRTQLAPFRALLAEGGGPYLGGETPGYIDYIVVSLFHWARACTPMALLAPDDPLAPWRERMLDLYGGIARRNPGYPW